MRGGEYPIHPDNLDIIDSGLIVGIKIPIYSHSYSS